MKLRILSLLAVLIVVAMGGQSFAGNVTYTVKPTDSVSDTDSNYHDLNDLDHHSAYVWEVAGAVPGGLNLSTTKIVSATLTLTNIANWDTNSNKLFIHLFDTGYTTTSGVTSYIDDPNDNVFFDNFTASNPLANYSSGNTLLTTYTNLTMTPTTLTYNFSAAQLTALATYIANGNNFALGFDPDCHYYNDGISLTFTTSPITSTPEPASMTLLGTGLVGLGGWVRRRRKQ